MIRYKTEGGRALNYDDRPQDESPMTDLVVVKEDLEDMIKKVQ
jgi:hypothetical protein